MLINIQYVTKLQHQQCCPVFLRIHVFCATRSEKIVEVYRLLDIYILIVYLSSFRQC